MINRKLSTLFVYFGPELKSEAIQHSALFV